MFRRIAITFATVAILGLLIFLALAWRSSIAPIKRPALESFSADSVVRGESIAAIGHCASCHTSPGGTPFAGGYGVNTPFGIIYGTNITPDPDSGIGSWSLAAFNRALRDGVSRNGSHLFPAFPYTAYTKMSDDDIASLYAFLMTRPAARAAQPGNTVPFPLNIRAFQAGWKFLFFKSERFQTNPAKSADWNRGAYLAEALADCTGCHTPRNLLGATQQTHAYAGAVIDGWVAPSLNDDNPSPVPWTQDELFTFLRKGATPLHGATGSTMTQVIRNALDLPAVPDSDVQAIAVYFIDRNQSRRTHSDPAQVVQTAISASDTSVGDDGNASANIYAAACVSCHYNSGSAPLSSRPELALSSSLALSEPTNFIQFVLNGVGSKDGAPGLVMPAYGMSLNDADIAGLAIYLRRSRTRLPPWTDIEKKVADIRKQSSPGN